MKMLSKLLPGMLLSMISAACFAQKIDSRPKLFAAFPATVILDRSVLNNTFTFQKNDNVTVSFSGDFVFRGTVIDNSNRYDNLQLIIIRSTDNSNSLLQISKFTDKDNSISYAGRILNTGAADGYDIKNRDGNYFLQKNETQEIFQPCTL